MTRKASKEPAPGADEEPAAQDTEATAPSDPETPDEAPDTEATEAAPEGNQSARAGRVNPDA